MSSFPSRFSNDGPKPVKGPHGPEWPIQQAIIKFLKLRDWHVMVVGASEVTKGFPDLYAVHPKHRQRWIEVKNPLKFSWTAAQIQHFPRIHETVGIWVMFRATDAEYEKLFTQANWHIFQRRNRDL